MRITIYKQALGEITATWYSEDHELEVAGSDDNVIAAVQDVSTEGQARAALVKVLGQVGDTLELRVAHGAPFGSSGS